MITRRRVLLAVLALLIVGVGTVAWTLAGLPPVKYYFRYGLDPYCEPTGETVTYEGVEFVEIGPGGCKLQGIDPFAYIRDVLSRIRTTPMSRIDELTPRGWKLAREAAALTA